ncbi:hypothetical protein [Rickettsia endosymbiont of Orchestes rusci]
MIKSRHDTAFFQRSYSSWSSHGMTLSLLFTSNNITKQNFIVGKNNACRN